MSQLAVSCSDGPNGFEYLMAESFILLTLWLKLVVLCAVIIVLGWASF